MKGKYMTEQQTIRWESGPGDAPLPYLLNTWGTYCCTPPLRKTMHLKETTPLVILRAIFYTETGTAFATVRGGRTSQESPHESRRRTSRMRRAQASTRFLVRPLVLFGASPKERSVETGVSKSLLYAKAHLFEAFGYGLVATSGPPHRTRSRISSSFRPRQGGAF